MAAGPGGTETSVSKVWRALGWQVGLGGVKATTVGVNTI